MLARPRVAADAGVTLFDRERTKSTDFDPITAG